MLQLFPHTPSRWRVAGAQSASWTTTPYNGSKMLYEKTTNEFREMSLKIQEKNCGCERFVYVWVDNKAIT